MLASTSALAAALPPRAALHQRPTSAAAAPLGPRRLGSRRHDAAAFRAPRRTVGPAGSLPGDAVQRAVEILKEDHGKPTDREVVRGPVHGHTGIDPAALNAHALFARVCRRPPAPARQWRQPPPQHIKLWRTRAQRWGICCARRRCAPGCRCCRVWRPQRRACTSTGRALCGAHWAVRPPSSCRCGRSDCAAGGAAAAWLLPLATDPPG